MTNLKREVRFDPAYDLRDPNPAKNYGIHGAELCFYLSGPEGCIQFITYTNWHLPHVKAEVFHGETREPQPADLGYHAKKPQYEGQEPMSGDCAWTNGPCYYDGSSLRAIKMFDLLVSEGSEAVWLEMEKLYLERFPEDETTTNQD